MHKSSELRKLVPKLRERGYYIPKEQRKIDWGAYTSNQVNDIINSLHFIRDEVDRVHQKKSVRSVGRPPIDAGNLAKAILLAELFNLPERRAEGLIKLIGYHTGIDENIDDRVLGEAYKRLDVINILEKIFEDNKSSDGSNNGDGTGLEKSRKENYESTKKKNLYMTSIVDSREVVQAFDISGKQECKIMHYLVKYLTKSVKTLTGKLTLDAGFVDRKLTQLIEDSGLKPFIFPKRNLTLSAKGSPAWNRMWIKLLKSTQKWLEEYHIRSHTESFHSSFKRIFGIVTKLCYKATYVQVLCRIIHNNRRKINYFSMAII